MLIDLGCFIITLSNSRILKLLTKCTSDRKGWFELHIATHLCRLRSRRLFFVCFSFPLRLHSLLRRSSTKPPAMQTIYYHSFKKSPFFYTKNPGYQSSRHQEVQVNTSIVFSGTKSISQ